MHASVLFFNHSIYCDSLKAVSCCVLVFRNEMEYEYLSKVELEQNNRGIHQTECDVFSKKSGSRLPQTL